MISGRRAGGSVAIGGKMDEGARLRWGLALSYKLAGFTRDFTNGEGMRQGFEAEYRR